MLLSGPDHSHGHPFFPPTPNVLNSLDGFAHVFFLPARVPRLVRADWCPCRGGAANNSLLGQHHDPQRQLQPQRRHVRQLRLLLLLFWAVPHVSTPRTVRGILYFRTSKYFVAMLIYYSFDADWWLQSDGATPFRTELFRLPGGKGVFLVSNVAPAKVRDPLMLSFAADGLNFSASVVVQTCTDIQIPGSKLRSGCGARQKANGNVGPSYPQGMGNFDTKLSCLYVYPIHSIGYQFVLVFPF